MTSVCSNFCEITAHIIYQVEREKKKEDQQIIIRDQSTLLFSDAPADSWATVKQSAFFHSGFPILSAHTAFFCLMNS